MATFRIDSNDTFSVEVTAQESDKYSQAIFLKFERVYKSGDVTGCDEMFFTTDELDLLGKFLIRQAGEIRTQQAMRE